MKHQTVGLQFDFQKSKRAKPWKTALPIAGVPLLAAVLLLALKPARESLKCLCNLVFAASETELAEVRRLKENADKNGVPGVRVLDRFWHWAC